MDTVIQNYDSSNKAYVNLKYEIKIPSSKKKTK